jgi:hypothetical protein
VDKDDPERWFMASVGPPNYKQIKKYVLWWWSSWFVSLVLVGIAETVTRYRYEEIIGPIPGCESPNTSGRTRTASSPRSPRRWDHQTRTPSAARCRS